MEKIIEVVEQKIKDYNSLIDFHRSKQQEHLEASARVVLEVQELERQLEGLRQSIQPKARKTRSDKKPVTDSEKLIQADLELKKPEDKIKK